MKKKYNNKAQSINIEIKSFSDGIISWSNSLPKDVAIVAFTNISGNRADEALRKLVSELYKDTELKTQ